MCEDCWNDDEYQDEGVTLVRRYPKNRATTPAEWLIGYDVARGHYDLVDKSSVQADESYRSPVVGYYTSYRGASNRAYSQPMFTFKDAGQECRYCVTYPEDTNHPVERFFASIGCECGNIAYTRDCPDHPAPKVDSRWVRLQQAGDSKCNNCDKRLKPHDDTFHEDWRFYCSLECNQAWKLEYERRKAMWANK